MEGKAICPPFEILAFYTAFDFSWDAQFDFSGECHEMWEIVFLTDGAVECVEDGKVYLLEQGDTVLHAPMEFHRIRSARGTSPSGYIISFTVRGELPAVLKNGVFRLDDGEASTYCEICRKVIGFLRGEGHTAYAGQEAAALLTAYLIRLSAGREANTRLVTSRSALTYRRLVSVMTEGAREGRTLADIAAAFTHDRYVCIPDRAEAIAYAVKNAKKGDVVLLAGKGHEQYQLIHGKFLPFSEREILMQTDRML